MCAKLILLLYCTSSSMLFTRRDAINRKLGRSEMGKEKKKKERRRDNHRETDDDDRRNWIWVKDSKPLSLNANIKGLVGRGENMEL